MNRIQWTKKAIKQLLTIDKRYINTIHQKVDSLSKFPSIELDCKKIIGSENQYRLRVGTYRVIFEVIQGEPVIISIEAIKRRSSKTYSSQD